MRAALVNLVAVTLLTTSIGCVRSAPPSQAAAPPAGWGAPPPAGGYAATGRAPQPAGLSLPPPHTDAGVLSRMLIAECRGPGYADYDEGAAYWTMQAMKAVVHNRLVSDPARFGAPGSRWYGDIICAPGQWHGFGRDPGGRWLIDSEVHQRVDDIVRHANSGTPGRYHRFVQHALAITYGGVSDPFAQLRSIDGQPVRPGTYGWRRAGSSHPGGSFIAIPSQQGGIIAGNQFYALAAQ